MFLVHKPSPDCLRCHMKNRGAGRQEANHLCIGVIRGPNQGLHQVIRRLRGVSFSESPAVNTKSIERHAFLASRGHLPPSLTQAMKQCAEAAAAATLALLVTMFALIIHTVLDCWMRMRPMQPETRRKLGQPYKRSHLPGTVSYRSSKDS
jgi:hypothetical protein